MSVQSANSECGRRYLIGRVPGLALLPYRSTGEPVSDVDAWRLHCEKARMTVREFRVRAEDTMGVRVSRDPTERVAVVLHDAFPLKRILEFVEALEGASPPPAHERVYRAWLRDVALCRMLVSNPLRVGQYAAMTFKLDNSGILRRTGPGRYRLHFEPSDFKNEKGAANVAYVVEVDDSVGPWLDRYLAESRPYLVGAADTTRFPTCSGRATKAKAIP